jgi:RNA polymerase sigma factor (sigma-70 family)
LKEQAETGILSLEEANQLVLEHQGWAESIARSVARSWNMDWRLDGLDGAAMEALIFCARRFQPARGVPFRGYARKRIHEASTDAARKSRGWKRGSVSSAEHQAREISAELFNVFPELRVGELPSGDDYGEGEDGARSAIRELLVGASIIAYKQGMMSDQPDEQIDYKRMVEYVADLDPVHQVMVWKLYWEGLSMRSLATEWEIDELNVIREHKVLLAFLAKSFAKGKPVQKPKVRPGLKEVALNLKRAEPSGPFTKILRKGQSHG